jgi:hypothetical protein
MSVPSIPDTTSSTGRNITVTQQSTADDYDDDDDDENPSAPDLDEVFNTTPSWKNPIHKPDWPESMATLKEAVLGSYKVDTGRHTDVSKQLKEVLQNIMSLWHEQEERFHKVPTISIAERDHTVPDYARVLGTESDFFKYFSNPDRDSWKGQRSLSSAKRLKSHSVSERSVRDAWISRLEEMDTHYDRRARLLQASMLDKNGSQEQEAHVALDALDPVGVQRHSS